MATELCDPRVFFAAERTLLAWLRTGLTIMALGFVISRFGLFIKLVALESPALASSVSSPLTSVLGIAFVLIGSLAIVTAAIQHRRFLATLSDSQLSSVYSSTIAFILSISIAMLGVALAAYLWHA